MITDKFDYFRHNDIFFISFISIFIINVDPQSIPKSDIVICNVKQYYTAVYWKPTRENLQLPEYERIDFLKSSFKKVSIFNVLVDGASKKYHE